MRRRRFLATVGATVAATSGCTRFLEGSSPVRFRYGNDGPLTALAVGADTVYVGGQSPTAPGQVVALDPASGDRRWAKATTAPGNTLSITERAGALLVWTTATLTLSVMDGFVDTPWTRSRVASFPPPAADAVVFLHRRHSVEAVDVHTGERRWRTHPTGAEGTLPIPRPELVATDVLVAATWGGHLAGIDPDSGTLRWWAFTRNVGPRLTLGDGAVFVGGEYARGPVRVDRLDPRTGIMETLAAFRNRHATPVFATADQLVVQTHGAPGDALSSLDPRTGARHWQVTDLKATTASTDPNLLVGYDSERNQVIALDPTTGARRWTREPPSNDDGVALAMTDSTVIVRGASALHGLDRHDGSHRFRFEFDPDAVGRPLVATTDAAVHLVIGSTLYVIPA
ncbi:MAG: PQQ-binding-like beta-propeller repeat protein [Halobacteriaceae archaeon]